ncbi:MAG: cytochrome P450 [Actinobacteria bacterium]|nr:cytochrome P450 [Actinomycetota bacterium]
MTSVGIELNPFSPEFHADPYPTYRRLRDDAPCYVNEAQGWYALSRYDDVLDASQQPLLYSSAEGTTIERVDTRAIPPMMIFLDPPSHDDQRKLVSRVFTPRAIAALEPFVREAARACLAPLRDNGGGDFVQEFSAIVPMNVIMELIGVPADDRNQLRHWMDASLERTDTPPYIPRSALEAMANSMNYWGTLLADTRAHPNDGLMSGLIAQGLPDGEIVGFCALIGSAGTETLTKLLANAAVLFQRNPSEWQKVLDNLATIPGAVEETLRYWAPSQYQGRVLTEEVAVHGVTMPVGSRVLLLTGSANRDERQYADPDRFDISRDSHLPIGFGHGVHFCLGAALARLEGRVALEEFALAFPRYEIDESKAVRVHMSNVHGFESVPFTSS